MRCWRLGDHIGVVPQVEVWGFSKTLPRLGQAALVAIESGHPKACVLPDVYHLYKGGSDFTGLKLLNGAAVHVFHMNDYPADPPRESIGDSDRVYPGDGVAPLTDILRRCATSASTAICRSSCSTKRIGSKIRSRWRAWRSRRCKTP